VSRYLEAEAVAWVDWEDRIGGRQAADGGDRRAVSPSEQTTAPFVAEADPL
jgi:hypothetical protein